MPLEITFEDMTPLEIALVAITELQEARAGLDSLASHLAAKRTGRQRDAWLRALEDSLDRLQVAEAALGALGWSEVTPA